MTGKKFEKKIDEASERKLSEMYLNRMDYKPDTRTVEELRVLSGKLTDPQMEELQYSYYEREIEKLNKNKFRVLTGYGQCRGSLIVHHGEVVICCCREMASLVAFKNAHHYRGKIYVPGERGNASNHNGSVFIISDEVGMSFRTCPFCEAGITEKIDFREYSEDQEEDE